MTQFFATIGILHTLLALAGMFDFIDYQLCIRAFGGCVP